MRFLLYSRRGCHLCEEAEDLLAPHGHTVEIRDVDADPGARETYGLRVPVLLDDGVVVMEGRFDEAALGATLRRPRS